MQSDLQKEVLYTQPIFQPLIKFQAMYLLSSNAKYPQGILNTAKLDTCMYTYV